MAQLILLQWRNNIKAGVKIFCLRTTVLKKQLMFMQQWFYKKSGFWNEQAKPLSKIMNQHDQRGMQSWKVKDIGKDLENSSSHTSRLLRYSLWYLKKDILYMIQNCPHQWPTQTESGSKRGKKSWT